MRMHVVQTAGSGDLGALRDAAGDGRAAAMQRRRQLAMGKRALNAGRTAAADGASAPVLTLHRGGAG